MSKIKELSKYNGSAWETGVPIGADASNVDVTVSGGGTQNLQTVLGTPSNTTSIQAQLNTKLSSTGDGSSTTVTGISNYDTDSEETSKDLVTQVVASDDENQATLWGKFNRFRKRVSNKFTDYFATANLTGSSAGVTSSGDDNHAYTTAALNAYFSSVVGYSSAADVSSVGSVASQLSSLNSKISHIGMVIYSTTLDTAAKVKAIYGGTTWSQISGRFILAANSTYTVKSTGGSKDAIIPYHRHNVAKVTNGISGGNHNHTWASDLTAGPGSSRYAAAGKSATTGGTGAHNHDLPQHYTDYVGTSGNTTGANMPPYYAVYIWERTA